MEVTVVIGHTGIDHTSDRFADNTGYLQDTFYLAELRLVCR